MVNHLYLFVELIIISTNKLVTLNDQKKKIHVSFEGLVCFASDLYPQTDLETENGPESLLRRWLTCITNLFQVCHHVRDIVIVITGYGTPCYEVENSHSI